jgi:hypothetical protein|tara:strand:- start:14925 stop:15227 length:303 start_codon:yes stop_codon:yes gene_type:complete
MKLEELLRNFILQILAEEKDKEENLLGEPDLSKEDEREDDDEGYHDEQNAISTGGGALQSTGQMAGVMTPLGTGPSYPNKSKKKKKKKSKKDDVDKDWYK